MAPGNAIFLLLLASLSSSAAAALSSGKSLFGCYKSIVSFGDSIADTGNILAPSLHILPPTAASPPYGRTFFHRPTGRSTDGRLIIDFMAQSLGLPLVQPYVSGARPRNFSTGVNFAVSGATALEYEFLKKIGYLNFVTNVSLGNQLDWFRSFLAGIPGALAIARKDAGKYLESSLVVIGEIGGNDYNYPLEQGTTLEELQSLVPPVISYVRSAIQEVIKLGAVTILVPGNFPIGCLPVYLTSFKNSSTNKDYDPRTGCLNWLNEFSQYHNNLLLKELSLIRKLHPHVNILYADYYNATLRLYLSPDRFGFGNRILKACCGGGGPYNVKASSRCGFPQSTCCKDPSSYANWDGVHYTEAAYKLIAQGLLEGPYTDPQFTTVCTRSLSKPSGLYSDF